ncbi:hypothetical protein C0991_000014 [Blastosporella zonata]|nr:hypothetical protein C0991_000014 [Blastosporella zonata]
MKAKIIHDVVYRQYASLFFICEIGEDENELLALEIIHRYVEILDSYFGNVRSIGAAALITQPYHHFYAGLRTRSILDELLVAGEMQESSKKTVLTAAASMEVNENDEDLVEALRESFLT